MSGNLAVMDLEWTSWEGARQRMWSGPGEEMEIVAIGLVLLADDAHLTELRSSEILIRPRLNPTLSEYFIDLTGITQQAVDARGQSFPDALLEMQQFIGPDVGAIYSFGTDGDTLEHNCQLNGIPSPFLPKLFLNARDIINPHLGDRASKMESGRLPEAMGFEAPGQAHNAVDDCRCIAEALRIIRGAGGF